MNNLQNNTGVKIKYKDEYGRLIEVWGTYTKDKREINVGYGDPIKVNQIVDLEVIKK